MDERVLGQSFIVANKTPNSYILEHTFDNPANPKVTRTQLHVSIYAL
jgi:hypothetical protein